MVKSLSLQESLSAHTSDDCCLPLCLCFGMNLCPLARSGARRWCQERALSLAERGAAGTACPRHSTGSTASTGGTAAPYSSAVGCFQMGSTVQPLEMGGSFPGRSRLYLFTYLCCQGMGSEFLGQDWNKCLTSSLPWCSPATFHTSITSQDHTQTQVEESEAALVAFCSHSCREERKAAAQAVRVVQASRAMVSPALPPSQRAPAAFLLRSLSAQNPPKTRVRSPCMEAVSPRLARGKRLLCSLEAAPVQPLRPRQRR